MLLVAAIFVYALAFAADQTSALGTVTAYSSNAEPGTDASAYV
jgi:hypothetical protein